jgi:hypothetical protein
MTCRDCEPLLAHGEFCADLKDHLEACPNCQTLAHDLHDNAEALRAMRDDPLVGVEQALACNGGFSRRPRPSVWIGAAAASVLLLAFASLWRHQSAPLHEPPPPQIAAALPVAPIVALSPTLARPRKARRSYPVPAPAREEPMLVKMLTPDPDVVIYWIVEPKEKAE